MFYRERYLYSLAAVFAAFHITWIGHWATGVLLPFAIIGLAFAAWAAYELNFATKEVLLFSEDGAFEFSLIGFMTYCEHKDMNLNLARVDFPRHVEPKTVAVLLMFPMSKVERLDASGTRYYMLDEENYFFEDDVERDDLALLKTFEELGSKMLKDTTVEGKVVRIPKYMDYRVEGGGAIPEPEWIEEKPTTFYNYPD